MSCDHAKFIKVNTFCTFGRGSKVILAPTCGEQDNVDDHLKHIVEDFKHFVESGAIESADVYLVAFENQSVGESLEALSNITNRLFRLLSDNDPAGINCMDQAIDDPAWIFCFAGQNFYPIATAPCYPAHSSRYNGGSSVTHIMFLPQAAFKRRHQPGQTTLPDTARIRIRQEYEKQGMPYDLAISSGSHECYKIIKPLGYGDAPIRWWEKAPTVS